MRTLIKAIFRIFLIFAFIGLLRTIINNISNVLIYDALYYSQEIWLNIFVYSVVFLFFLVILFILWWKTEKILKFIVGEIIDTELVITTTNSELHRTVMRFIGIFLIVSAIPTVVGILGHYLLYKDNYPLGFQSYDVRELIILGTTILLGIWLVVGNKGILKVYHGIKDYTQPPLDENNEQK